MLKDFSWGTLKINGFEDFLNVVDDNPFEETPVPLEKFLYGEEYLNFPRLSEIQTIIVEAMSNVYKHEDNVRIWGQERADMIKKYSKKEVVMALGKSSGKDLLASIAIARVVYLLLCLKDPAVYYGKPSGDSIYLINVAINAKQAKNVFFKGNLLQRIKSCRWFAGKYSKTADSISFDKNVTALSGNSEAEGWEGYNILVAILDEISGFETKESGESRTNTADDIYNMYKLSVASRFPEHGKVALLSFPRHKNCFISKRYNEVVQEKVTELREHTFQIHEDRPIDEPGNSFKIEWEHDTILSYTEPDVVAFKRPSWEVNPTVTLEGLKGEFLRDKAEALKRLACMPPDTVDGYFSNRDWLEKAFPTEVKSPFYSDWQIRPEVKPVRGRKYYAHVDLAYKKDRASVAVASLERWVKVQYSSSFSEISPLVSIDFVRYWEPSNEGELQIDEVMKFITKLKREGYDLRLVTYDKWQSISQRQSLKRDYGIETDILSVGKPEYDDFVVALGDGRIRGYDLPLLIEEFMSLQLIKGDKVDHKSKTTKDVSDSVVGAAYNVSANEKYSGGASTVEAYFPVREEPEPEPEPEEEFVDKPVPRSLKEFFSIV